MYIRYKNCTTAVFYFSNKGGYYEKEPSDDLIVSSH